MNIEIIKNNKIVGSCQIELIPFIEGKMNNLYKSKFKNNENNENNENTENNENNETKNAIAKITKIGGGFNSNSNFNSNSYEYECRIYEKMSKHINIVEYYGWFTNEHNIRGILLEHVKTDLFYYIRDNDIISYENKIFILRQLISALQHLYSYGKIYYDLKPENVLITEDLIVKLCDFDNISYTICYAPPEFLNNKPSKYSIIWSFGMTIYTMFEKKTPYQSDYKNNDEVIRKITEGILPSMSSIIPTNISNIIKNCCKVNELDRLKFSEILLNF